MFAPAHAVAAEVTKIRRRIANAFAGVMNLMQCKEDTIHSIFIFPEACLTCPRPSLLTCMHRTVSKQQMNEIMKVKKIRRRNFFD